MHAQTNKQCVYMFANVNINEAEEKYSQNIISCIDKCHLFFMSENVHYISENGKLTLKRTLNYLHNVVKSKQNVENVLFKILHSLVYRCFLDANI